MLDLIATVASTILQWILFISICAFMILRVELFVKLVVYSALGFCIMSVIGIAAAPLMLVVSPLLLLVVVIVVAVIPLMVVFRD